jgi:hypothetical protein
MKTYAETQWQKKFDWFDELTKAYWKEPGVRKKRALRILSMSWTTCACGNQCAMIPRSIQGEPKDKLLAALGKRFYEYVKGCQWVEAIGTLTLIEHRSAELIAIEKTKLAEKQLAAKSRKAKSN